MTNQKQRRRQRRLEPFKAETPLINLINPKHYAAFNEWIDALRPMLKELPRTTLMICRLDFDFSRGFKKQQIYRETALFLLRGKVLRVPKNVFFRYLCHAEHGNLGIKFYSLESYINDALSNWI